MKKRVYQTPEILPVTVEVPDIVTLSEYQENDVKWNFGDFEFDEV